MDETKSCPQSSFRIVKMMNSETMEENYCIEYRRHGEEKWWRDPVPLETMKEAEHCVEYIISKENARAAIMAGNTETVEKEYPSCAGVKDSDKNASNRGVTVSVIPRSSGMFPYRVVKAAAPSGFWKSLLGRKFHDVFFIEMGFGDGGGTTKWERINHEFKDEKDANYFMNELYIHDLKYGTKAEISYNGTV